MKAAVLRDFGQPLTIDAVPDPVPARAGEVLVEVMATRVLPYCAEVFSGARKYPLEPPVIPGVGGVGRVVAAGPDATRIRPGDVVWCDSTVRSRDDALTPDITLQGWSSRGEGGLALSRYFHDGAFAERMVVPTENVTALAGLDFTDDRTAAARRSALGVSLVPFGGLLAADLQAGETLLVSGATGYFGSAGVAVGLAMGAGLVVTPGRNDKALADLHRRFGDRVRPVRLTGDGETDRQAMLQAAGHPIDVVLDLLPPAAGQEAVRAAAMTVREYGRVVLMGGVGMLGGDDLQLPYPWLMRNSVTVRGQWMYPRIAIGRLVALARCGLLDLAQEDVTIFSLDDANAAVRHAAEHGGPFERTVITPLN